MQIVPMHCGVCAHRAQIRGDELETIALFHPQFADLAEYGRPARPARQYREDRDLVHERRNLCGDDLRSLERGGTHEQIGDRLPTFVAQVHALDVRTHALEYDEKPDPRGIDTDVFDEELALLREHRRSDEKCRARSISGDGKGKGRYGG